MGIHYENYFTQIELNILAVYSKSTSLLLIKEVDFIYRKMKLIENELRTLC